jgi:hypothetical protein
MSFLGIGDWGLDLSRDATARHSSENLCHETSIQNIPATRRAANY